MRRFLSSFLLSLLIPGLVLLSAPRVAHADSSTDVGSEKSPLEVRNAVGTILISGLVGGIIGLSTLSFYPRPQDNIRNIFFGAGAGMIIATLYMTFNVATRPVDQQINNATKNSEEPRNFALVPYADTTQAGVLASYRF